MHQDNRKRQREGETDEEKRLHAEEARLERKRLRQEQRAAAVKVEIKYPVEDLELPDALAPAVQPPPASTEFTVPQELLTDLIVSWVFLQTFAYVVSTRPCAGHQVPVSSSHPRSRRAAATQATAVAVALLAGRLGERAAVPQRRLCPDL